MILFLLKSIKYSAIYARTILQANVVSEIFKRTARDAELKNALAHRKEREDERARVREIRINEFRQDITSKGPFPGTYHSQSEKILETEKDMNASCNGDRDIEGQVEEEYIRDMASRVLQARWRIMRFVSSFFLYFLPSFLPIFLATFFISFLPPFPSTSCSIVVMIMYPITMMMMMMIMSSMIFEMKRSCDTDKMTGFIL